MMAMYHREKTPCAVCGRRFALSRQKTCWQCAKDKKAMREFFLKLVDSGESLSGFVLEEVDFSGANLKGIDLSGALLRSCNFKGVNLLEANLEKANAWKANFKDANLRQANLEFAVFGEANLCDAQLCGTNLQRANLQETTFHR